MTIDPKHLNEMIDFYADGHKDDEGKKFVAAAELEIEVLQGKCDPSGDKLKPEKFEIKLEPYHGDMSINLLDYLNELLPETKEELLADHGWWPFVCSEMSKDIKQGLASKNFNSRIFEMRQALLQSDVLPEILRMFVIEVVQEAARDIKVLEKYRAAYYEIFNSTFARNNQELEKFIRTLDTRVPDYSYIDSTIVKETLDELWKKMDITQQIEAIRLQEAEVLGQFDPEAAARAEEAEEQRKARSRW
jgi:hypothetical protein